MGIGHFLKKGLKIIGGPLVEFFSFQLSLLKPLLNALITIPKPPGSIEQSGQLGNVDVRVNQPTLGDIKPIVIGTTRVWFRLCSASYTFFEGHDQFLAAYLHATVGNANVLQVRIGDTSANRFPGFTMEVLQPGEDMSLILPNVYTCPEVADGIELIGGGKGDDSGADENTTPTDPYKIVTIKRHTDNGGTFEDLGALVGSRITSNDEGFFADLLPHDVIRIFDGSGFDGQYIVQSIADDYKSVVVFPETGSGDDQETWGFFLQQRWAGPYPACPPGATVDKIAVDIVFNALRDDDQEDNLRGVIVKVQYRPIDDAGNVLDDWTTADDGVSPYDSVYYIDNVNRQRRYTTEFTLSAPMRCEVRVWRQTYEQADQSDPSSAAQWVGLKGYIVALAADAPRSDPDSTRIAVLIRSSGKLSAASQKAVNGLVQHVVPKYEDGAWTDPQVTSNPWWNTAWWVTSQSKGAITLEDLDADEIATLAADADARGATCNYNFDRQVLLWEGAQTIARTDRGKLILDTNSQLFTGYRDEPSDPVQLFADGFHCRVGQDALRQPDADTVTGVQVKITDPLLWQLREGPIVGSADDPRVGEFPGCTTWLQGWYEAQFQYRDLLYRGQTFSMEAEMEGLLPRHGKRVIVASAMKGWGQGTEVIDTDGLTWKVRPAPIWTEGVDHYVYVQSDDGTPIGPIAVTKGIADHYLILADDPGISPRTGATWKTLLAFGHDGDEDSDIDPDAPRLAVVVERQGNDPRSGTLQLMFDNAFVHADPGAPPDDPYSYNATPPVLTVTGLAAHLVYSGILIGQDGGPIFAEDGSFIELEDATAGVVVSVDWDDTTSATDYSMRWKKVGDAIWHAGYSGIASEAVFGVTSNGTYQIRVKAFSGSYVGVESVTSIVVTGF